MKDFSQNNEQKHILNYFFQVGAPPTTNRQRCVLSLGENDGETLSNSRALILSGFMAVLVEPAEKAFDKLSQLYKGRTQIKCVNAAIAQTDGPIDFYDCGSHLGKGDTSLLATTNPAEIARWKKSGEVFTKTTVRGITFNTLMAETGVSHFDFISIDCEGVDYQVLSQIDLTKTGTSLVCVEYNGKEPQKYLDYCAKHGLTKVVHRNFENLIIGK